MKMTMEDYNKYCIYKRRDDYLGNPFGIEGVKSDSDYDEIDKFLKVIDNYIHLSSRKELKE